jgi:hypothetical protein
MCEHIKMPNGDVAIICGLRSTRRYCSKCGRPAALLCDWKVASKRSGTCDRALCAQHAEEVAPGKHLCPEHQQAWELWKIKHPPAQPSLFQA